METASRTMALPQRPKRRHLRVRTGCLTCRMKCDETKPVCGRCARLRLKCEGALYGTSRLSTTLSTVRSSAPSFLIHPSSNPRLQSTGQVRDLIHLIPRLLQASNYAQLMDPITSVPAYIKSRGKPLGIFLEFLPARSGYNPALDSTVECVVGALRDLVRPQDSRNWSTTYTAYGQALQHLQASLNDPGHCTSAETLCATQLLGIFESLTSETGQTSNNHSEGTAKLIQLRGPQGFSSPFEKALLAAQAPVINISALFRARGSFLDDEGWKETLRSTAMSNPTTIDISELEMSKYDLSLPLGGIIKDVTAIVLMGDVPGRDEIQAKLLKDVDIMLEVFDDWDRRWHDIVLPPKSQTEFTRFGRGDSRDTRMGYHLFQQAYLLVYQRMKMLVDRDAGVEWEHVVRKSAYNILANPLVEQNSTSRVELTIAWGLAHSMLSLSEEWEQWLLYRDTMPRDMVVLPPPEMWRRHMLQHGMRPDYD